MITRRAALYALGVIFLANFFNYIDRQLVSALEKPISQAMASAHGHFTEAEFGYLWTLFTIGYMLCAVPIGMLADRWSRTRLFALCIVVWSLATVASGLAQTKWVLYVARVFIGVGEAGCLIIGPSLISDYFKKEVRGRALSVFYLGLPIGGTAAFIMAGLLRLYDVEWRVLFYAAGVPGFLIAALIWALQDPPRGTAEGLQHGMSKVGLREYAGLLRNRTLLLVIVAQAFAVVTLVPLIHYGAGFFVNTRGMSEHRALIALGVIALVAGALGNTLSGVIGDKLSKRGIKGAYALLAGVAFLAGWPCLLIGFRVSNPVVYLPAVTLGAFCIFLCMPAVNTQIANVVSPAQRATAWALAVFILHLLGDTLAPPLFGKVSSALQSREQAFTLFSISLVLAGVASLLASRTAAADMERVARRVEQEAKL